MSYPKFKIEAHVLVVSLSGESAIKEKINNKNLLYHRGLNKEGIIRSLSGDVALVQHVSGVAAYTLDELREQLTLW